MFSNHRENAGRLSDYFPQVSFQLRRISIHRWIPPIQVSAEATFVQNAAGAFGQGYVIALVRYEGIVLPVVDTTLGERRQFVDK